MKSSYIFLLSITLMATSCRKFLELNAPKSELVTETVFGSDETANAVMLTIYADMSSGGFTSPYSIVHYTGLSSDELMSNSNTTTDMYINDIDPINLSHTNPFWRDAFKIIYNVNALYEGCEKSEKLSPLVKKQLMSEALFVRAYWYFYLTNLYGAIPIVRSTDYTTNASLKKSPVSEVYNFIIADLKAAQNDLNENYVGSDGLSPFNDRVRPNKAAATALLARVYLYVGNYPDAAEQSSLLIDNGSYYTLDSLNGVFLIESKEAIWQLMAADNTSYNTLEGNKFIPTKNPPSTTGNPNLREEMLPAFEAGDKRKNEWVGKYTDTKVTPNKDYYYPHKYKVQTGTSLSEYAVILRLTEQYLIRAEARNEQNDIIGAVADINIVRSRARDAANPVIPNPLPALENTLSKEEVSKAIMNERRVELFAEQGHRWLDLKRTETIDAVMTTVTLEKGGVWNSNKQLWPIPQSEIIKNPNLEQNPGYN